jgi:hypothetical protein
MTNHTGSMYRVTVYYRVQSGLGKRRISKRDDFAVVAESCSGAIRRACDHVLLTERLYDPEISTGDFAPTATLDSLGIAVLS